MARSKKGRAQRRADKRARQNVRRSERVPATPETLAKLKPWPMQSLLRLGPEDGGIGSDEFEAGLQIVEAFDTITKGLGYKPLDLARVGHGTGEIGPRGCRLWNIYVAWGNEFWRRTMVRPHAIVEMVNDERPAHPAILSHAAALWATVAREYDQRQRVERHKQAA